MSESNKSGDRSIKVLGRRVFLSISGAALVTLAWRRGSTAVEAAASAVAEKAPKQVMIVEFTDAGERKGIVSLPKIQKSSAEWKKALSPGSYEVTRNASTESPFSGVLLKVHDKGVFRCICCDTAIFSSETKFESNTGWPSFWAPIAKENIVESWDLSENMQRRAISCVRCDAHLGHLFSDGPRPTGSRYCMNSVAMKFVKA